MTTTQPERRSDARTTLLTRGWYRNYVPGVLTLCYVVHVMGFIGDRLAPSFQTDSLRYALVIIGVVNVGAALHYLVGARHLRQDLEATEKLAAA